MLPVIDPVSGLRIGDVNTLPPLLLKPVVFTDVQSVLNSFILSASGWRSIFVASGNEEDSGAEISPAHLLLAAGMAASFADALPILTGRKQGQIRVLVACDSRPSGELIADAMLRVFVARQCSPRFIFIASAPEAMAYAKMSDEIDAFAYISASHNPIGHNGVKFGLKTGGVLSGEQIKPLIEAFRNLMGTSDSLPGLQSDLLSVSAEILQDIFRKSVDNKKESLAAYSAFITRVIADAEDKNEVARNYSLLQQAVKQRPIGIVAELNGSARTLTIDAEYLSELGLKLKLVNDKPRQIVHRIVPEGRSLDQCLEELEKAYALDPAFILGYVPDNDGDRGNIVYIDEKTGTAHILEAQEVFALSCLAELCWLVYSGKLRYDNRGKALQKVAIAVNDPTSMRVEDIAACFGAEVFRAEVGEANVVNLAVELRTKGYIVRILGEGSNGGTIVHPSAVRDPLNTIASLVKLLAIQGGNEVAGLFEIWCARSDQSCNTGFGLAEIIDSVPRYTTTSSYEDRALMHIQGNDHARLKASYEKIFLSEWPSYQDKLLQRLNIYSWEEINYEGTDEIQGFGSRFRTGKERGGFKILFKDAQGGPVAYLWMRGSGTEPVFRVLVDLKGQRPLEEAWLLEWHKSMIRRADEETIRN